MARIVVFGAVGVGTDEADEIILIEQQSSRVSVGDGDDGVPTFANLVEVTRFARDIGGNTVFRFSAGHALTVEGILPEQFEVTDFIFAGA